MKVKYDKEVDVLYISLSQKTVGESDESKPGIIIDYSIDGDIVGKSLRIYILTINFAVVGVPKSLRI